MPFLRVSLYAGQGLMLCKRSSPFELSSPFNVAETRRS